MDAIKFLQERERLCRSYHSCNNCPLRDLPCGGVPHIDAERVVDAVEEWSAAHPRKTRQSVFLSHYPNAEVDEDGVLKVCPKVVEGSSYMDSHKCGLVPCAVCHKAYWSVIVKEGNADNGAEGIVDDSV